MRFLYKAPSHDEYEPHSGTRSCTTYWSVVGVPHNNQDKVDVTYPYIDHSPLSTAVVVAGAPRRVVVGARAVGGCLRGSRRAQGSPKAWWSWSAARERAIPRSLAIWRSWSAARVRAIPRSLTTCTLRCSSSAWRRRANCSEAWKALRRGV